MDPTDKTVPLTVNLTGLIAIFGKHLYTEFGAIVRELVQNAHDGIAELNLTQIEHQPAPRIDVIFRPSDRTLIVADNGIGMSSHDLEQKLNNFASSDKRALKAALEGVGSQTAAELIGEFGVGCLSAMAVSNQVQVHTAKAGSPSATWTFQAGQTSAEIRELGTDAFSDCRIHFGLPPSRTGTITVCRLTQDCIEGYGVDANSVYSGIEQFVNILPYNVFFNGDELLNDLPLAWREPATATEHDWRAAITDDDPLFVIPLYSPPRELDLQGVMWFPKRIRIQDEGQLKIYIKRMFVFSDDSIVLPKWARFLRGMLNSNKMRRIVSGNTVALDKNARDAMEFVTAKIHETFRELRGLTESEYQRIIGPHDDVIKESAVDNPELLDIVWDKLRLRSRNRRITIPSYLEELKRSTGDSDKIYYFDAPQQEFSANLVSDSTHIPVLDLCSRANSLFASAVCDLRGIQQITFRALADSMFQPLQTDESEKYRSLILACAESNIAADLRRYEPSHVPAVLIEDKTMLERREELLRGLRDISANRDRQFIDDLDNLFRRDRAANRGVAFYLNAGNDLISELLDASLDTQEAVCLALYNISYMSAAPDLRRSEVQAVYGSICAVLMDLLRQMKEARESHSRPVLATREAKDQEMRPIRLMFFMPYESRYDQVERAIRHVFEIDPYYFEIVLARDFMIEGKIIESVRAHIAASDGFIAEISDANPSVMMEVGAVLIERGGPLFLLRSVEEARADVPADLRAELQIDYGRASNSVEEIAAAIRRSLERNGAPTHRDMQTLVSSRKQRALTRTLLSQLRYRLRDDEILRITKNISSVEELLETPVEALARRAQMNAHEVIRVQDSVKAYVAGDR